MHETLQTSIILFWYKAVAFLFLSQNVNSYKWLYLIREYIYNFSFRIKCI